MIRKERTQIIKDIKDEVRKKILPFLQLLLTRPRQNAQTLPIPLVYLGLTWIRNLRDCYYLQTVYCIQLKKWKMSLILF